MPTRPIPRRRRAFTLVEIVVTLALAVIVIVTVRAVYDVVAGGGALVGRVARGDDRVRNGRRVLERLLRSARLPTPGAPFVGSRDHVAFDAWCVGVGGWNEPCHVDIAIRVHSASAVADVQMGAYAAVLLSHPVPLELRYVANGFETWTATWESAASLPVAVALVSRGDTTLLRIGERG